MTAYAAAIERHRSLVRQAIKVGDMQNAGVLVGVIIGLRLCAGEIDVRLRPVKEVLVKGKKTDYGGTH